MAETRHFMIFPRQQNIPMSAMIGTTIMALWWSWKSVSLHQRDRGTLHWQERRKPSRDPGISEEEQHDVRVVQGPRNLRQVPPLPVGRSIQRHTWQERGIVEGERLLASALGKCPIIVGQSKYAPDHSVTPNNWYRTREASPWLERWRKWQRRLRRRWKTTTTTTTRKMQWRLYRGNGSSCFQAELGEG